MNARQFFDLVSKMRDAQHDYHVTKEYKNLKEALRLEQAVDTEIARVKLILKNKEKWKQS